MKKIAHPLVESYAVNERMNQIVLAYLNPELWRAKLPGRRTRTLAAIFAHLHNVRRKWLRLSAPHLPLPAPLDAARCSREEASGALQESADRCCEMLADALGDDRRVKKFLRDGWAAPWPADAAMAAYMLTHDAHHRGQACMLAHQLGSPLPAKCTSEMWRWEKLRRDCR